jgi:hypothetical protein
VRGLVAGRLRRRTRGSQGDCEVANVRSAVGAMCSVPGRVIDADPRPRECAANVIDADRRLLGFTAELGWVRLTSSSRLCGARCGSTESVELAGTTEVAPQIAPAVCQG